MAAPSYKFPFGTGAHGAPRVPGNYFTIHIPPYGVTTKTTSLVGSVRSVVCRWGKSRGILPLFIPT